MPPKRHIQHERPAPVTATPSEAFRFPSGHHLVITTQHYVLSWDKAGLKNIFRSGSGGILAAKEARDGSGLLAIADSQVVILHDIHKGIERSYTYKLKGTDGQVRLLEYSKDSKNLYFTTTLQNAVQSYSLRQSSLIDPGHTHPSAPTVLAVSSSHLLSASENPPTICLQNLTLQTRPQLIQPRASTSPVVVAAFHPERANIFLLGFKDGTLAAYDSTKLAPGAGRAPSGRYGQLGEIGHFKELHTVTNRGAVDPELDAAALGGYDEGTKTVGVGSQCMGIAGAAFLCGYRTRAVSVGADGRCRIVDFDCGGKILRTWHVRAPATSLSILPLHAAAPTSPSKVRGKGVRRTNNRSEASTKTGAVKCHVIAIGRLDGKVLLFDSVGLLLGEKKVDQDDGRILDLDWRHGSEMKTPSVQSTDELLEETVAAPSVADKPLTSKPEVFEDQQVSTSDSSNQNWEVIDGASGESIDFPGIKPPDVPLAIPPAVHADIEETDDSFTGTVNHKQLNKPAFRDFPLVSSNTYMDLFSPVKPVQQLPPSPQRRLRSGHPRPRICSTTFEEPPPSPVKSSNKITVSGGSGQTPASSVTTSERDTSRPQSADQQSKPQEPPPPFSPKANVAKVPLRQTPRARKARRVSMRRMPGAYISSESTTSSGSSYSKILVDIKRLGSNGAQKPQGLALLAPYMEPIKRRKSVKLNTDASAKEVTPNPVARGRQFGARAQAQENFLLGATDDDIWLTSDDESALSRPRDRARTARHASRTARPAQEKRKSILQCHPENPATSSDSPETRISSSDGHASHGILPSPSPLADRTATERYFSPREIARRDKALLPGVAQSPLGPVAVEEFFPRMSSLGPVPKESSSGEGPGNGHTLRPLQKNGGGGRGSPGRATRKRSARPAETGPPQVEALGSVEAAHRQQENVDRRAGECECRSKCCKTMREEMWGMRDEMREMRDEMREMREEMRNLRAMLALRELQP